ncbi:NAD(P)-binding domain-containing protein [Hymenobacter sp. 15J16-1T3B]|uniref:flavin-containing monooxygenase n=1 Tax=Hymenobacter sp. 15J16-1T3B TaxID=2886941 RepID=UPI001D116A04|nr:NAD(P)-binding domain-containing protein [Hymenobacter sp. 15J16-1T3B]MCC3158448.1 NAD(P)-binding domain-containing protein [Hymenobacter sp. 15J16-1T3B]
MKTNQVAIIGGGPAGIAAAKSLLEDGLTPVIIEQSGALGGQWNVGAAHSGQWPGMHANSCHIKMSFSDYDYPTGTQMFPTNAEVLAYLHDYAHHFGVDAHVRFHTRVELIARGPENQYVVWTVNKDGERRTELFERVIVASGRYNKPSYPDTPGLDHFHGRVIHSMEYRGREQFRGQRVLVVGNSISGLEIASDLAQDASITVISSARKPRYIARKIMHGLPTDQLAFTRFGAYINQALPPAEAAEGLKQLILSAVGNPADFGGLRPADSLMEAGVSQCQDYLDHVQSGRIRAVTGVQAYAPGRVVLTDGEVLEADAIILATGYDLHLPFLHEDLRRAVNADRQHLELHHFTFHPALPNFAFMGLYEQIGSYFVTAELQARWIAACWSGARPAPTAVDMAVGLAEARQQKQRGHATCQQVAELISHDLGVAPSIERYPELAAELFFGLLAPAQFRMEGHGQQPGARARFERNVRHFTQGQPLPLGEQEMGGLLMLAAKLPQHQPLQQLVKHLQPAEAVV